MSIITETLNRLEAGRPVPAGNLYRTSLPRPASKSMGLPVKVLATAMLVVFAGTGLMVWHWGNRLGGSTELPLAEAGSQTLPGGQPDLQLLPLPAAEQISLEPPTALQYREAATSADWPFVPAVPNLEEVVSETGTQQAMGNGSPLQAQSGEKPLAVANVKPGIVKTRSAKSKSAPAVSSKHQQTTAGRLAVRSVPRAAEAASEARKPHVRAKGSSGPARSGDKPMAVANVKLGAVKAPAAKSKSAPAASNKRQQTAAVVSLGDPAQPSAVDEAVERAQLALSRGQYQQALAALDTLSPVPERRADFWLLKGSAHLGLGQLDPAGKAFASAQLLAPDNAQIAVQWAILEQEKGDHASALRILEDAATRHSDVPEIFLNEGYSQQELGVMQDAARSYRAFLRMTEGRSLYAEQRKTVNQWLAQFSSTSD